MYIFKMTEGLSLDVLTIVASYLDYCEDTPVLNALSLTSDEQSIIKRYWLSQTKCEVLENSNGCKEWRVNGKLHREDGPAMGNAWYINGKLHREDGPAVVSYDVDELDEDDDTFAMFTSRREEWYINGKLHREDGPAVESEDEFKAWYNNGKLHREDGPAIEHANGSEAWYINGKLHCEDGPAIKHANGRVEWWVNGIQRHEDGSVVEPDSDEEWPSSNVHMSDVEYETDEE